MNQAALHSSEVLARFDAEADQTAEAQEDGAEQKRIALRSGRNISNQPYGEKAERDDSMSITNSGALVRFEPDASPVDYAEDQGSSRDMMVQQPSPPRRPLQFPASTINAPGIDALGQLATMQAKLNQRLGPEYISNRQGPGGGKLSYIEGWKAIDLANEVFGFNGWSSTIVRMDVDFIDEFEGKKFNVGVSVVMRITLRDGTFHEDIGYGHCENVKMKHMALEKARKEASTDGLKRALRTFGRMLGNCLYDKKFIDTASKMKAAVPTYDLTELKRTNAAPQPQQGQQPSPPSAAAAPTTRPAQGAPHQRSPPVQQKQAPNPQQQQQPHFTTVQQPIPDYRVKSTAAAPPSKVDQQVSAPTSVPQTKEARLREERKAMAAAKQAELRLRKEKEAAARQEASSSNFEIGNTSLAQQVSRGEGQVKMVPPATRGRRHSFEDELENVDDYDIALMAAGLDDEADIADQVVPKASTSVAKAFSTSSANDSGIGIIEDHSQKQARMQTKGAFSTVTPSAGAKGRFNDSSSPPYPANRNEISKLPSSSPKVQIPVKGGRRMSMLGNGIAKASNVRSSQELPSSQSRNRGSRPVAQNYRSTPAPATKRNGPGACNDTQFKKPRHSPN